MVSRTQNLILLIMTRQIGNYFFKNLAPDLVIIIRGVMEVGEASIFRSNAKVIMVTRP